MTTDIEQWRKSFVELRAEWNAIHRKKVEQWCEQFTKIRAEYHKLVENGEWQRGPSDLLSIIDRRRREVFHSSVIGWLMDPLAPHGLETAFLEQFLRKCNPNWSLVEERLNTVSVKCEVARGNCRADIVIWSDNFKLVIENKVDAEEGNRQCERLFQAFRDENDHVRFVFLTPRGRAPRSVQSKEATKAFETVSYRDVRRCIEGALESIDKQSNAKVGLATVRNYLATLKGGWV